MSITFLHTFPEDTVCTELYAPIQRFLRLSAFPIPLCIFVLSHLSFSSSQSLSLSPLSLSSVLFSFCFSHSLSISTLWCPPRYLSLQTWSLPGSLILYYASFSVSFSPPVSVILSPDSSSLWLYILATQSLPLSPCLAWPLSSPLLLSLLYLQVSLNTSLSHFLSSLLPHPHPHPHSLSPWEPSPLTETAPGQLCPKSAVSQSSHPR